MSNYSDDYLSLKQRNNLGTPVNASATQQFDFSSGFDQGQNYNDLNSGSTTSEFLFGKEDAKTGKHTKGNFGAISSAVLGAGELVLSYQALKETKAQNKRIMAQNKFKANNAANAYNNELERRTQARAAMGGHSIRRANQYINSSAFQKKKAKKLA